MTISVITCWAPRSIGRRTQDHIFCLCQLSVFTLANQKIIVWYCQVAVPKRHIHRVSPAAESRPEMPETFHTLKVMWGIAMQNEAVTYGVGQCLACGSSSASAAAPLMRCALCLETMHVNCTNDVGKLHISEEMATRIGALQLPSEWSGHARCFLCNRLQRSPAVVCGSPCCETSSDWREIDTQKVRVCSQTRTCTVHAL